jgi:hypothetical protein
LSHLLLAFELRLELGNLFLELKDLKLLLYIFKLGVHRYGGSFSSGVVLVLRAFWNLLLVGWRNFHGNFFDVHHRLSKRLSLILESSALIQIESDLEGGE